MSSQRSTSLAIVITVILVLGFEGFQYWSASANDCYVQVLKLQQQHLMLRRHEKDYLLRQQIEYKETWEKRLAQVKQQTEHFGHCLTRNTASQMAGLKGSLSQYETDFHRLITELKSANQQDLQILNRLMNEQEQLELLGREYNVNVYAQTLAIRQHLFTYITSENPISLQLLSNKVQTLSQWSSDNQELAHLISLYSDTIKELQILLQSRQYTHERGTMGSMRKHIHAFEDKLNHYELTMQPTQTVLLRIAFYLCLLIGLTIMRIRQV
ncbi:hypothetical protein [Shewanella waksmanii]|uniref:hypothetical protein n=1 Tax=Shewanella waksmanii TaxID=213783 RepID=UPI00048DA55A|nr:hypothetical protein [Shewanella waksmanii]